MIDFSVPQLHNFVAADLFVHNTALGLGIATHVAKSTHKPVLVFSLEMGHAELTQRVLSGEAEVESTKLRTGRLAESDWTKIGKAINRLDTVPLFLDDNPRVTVMEIRAKARRLKARHGGLAMIMIDYLQLMTGGTSSENRQLEQARQDRAASYQSQLGSLQEQYSQRFAQYAAQLQEVQSRLAQAKALLGQ